MISSGWRKARIGEIAEVKGGKRLPAGYYLQATPTHRPYIRVADMRVGGVDQSDIKYVPEGAISRIQNYRIYKDDIFISVAGTLGIVGRVPISLDGANLTENADRLTNIKCDVAYLMYALQSNPIQDEIDSIRTVGAQPKLALSRIRSFEILMPSDQAEQSRVSRALSDTDDLIESLERLISKKKAIKQGMMQELLTGRTRLSGFTEPWTNIVLGDVARFGKGSGLPKSALTSSGFTPCIHYGELFTHYGPEIIHVTSRTNLTDRMVVSEDFDVLMPTSDVTPRGLAKASSIHERGVVLGGDIMIIRPDKGRAHGPFLAHAIRHDANQVLQFVRGSTVYHLYAADMQNFTLAIPSVEEQRVIAQVLRDADYEIDTLHRRLESARNIKQGMMQELLTGRTRLPVEEVSS